MKKFFYSLLTLVLGLVLSGCDPDPDALPGTKNNPFVIKTAADLDNVRNNPSAYYVLGAHIDLEDYLAPGGKGAEKWGTKGWLPIPNFSGHLAGGLAHHKITGLWIHRPDDSQIGLFQTINGGSVNSVRLEIANKEGIAGDDYVGGMAGWVTSGGSIVNCSVTGGSIGGARYVGAMAGEVRGNGKITNSYTTNFASATHAAGGIAGVVRDAIITDCYTTGDIRGKEDAGGVAGSVVGGVVGGVGVPGEVSRCYATGGIYGEIRIGGIVGNVDNTYNVCKATNCVALNSEVSGINPNLGRVAGGFWGSNPLSSNLGRRNMTINKTPLDLGLDKVDGLTCVDFPTGDVWTGLGWSSSNWTFEENKLPKLRWLALAEDLIP